VLAGPASEQGLEYIVAASHHLADEIGHPVGSHARGSMVIISPFQSGPLPGLQGSKRRRALRKVKPPIEQIISTLRILLTVSELAKIAEAA
jgi:hypothetical protein